MTSRRENHLDNIFHAMGELKSFTILQAVVMGLHVLPSAYQLLSNVFICREIGHQCAAAPNGSFQHLSGLDEYLDKNLNVSYQQCEIVVSHDNKVLKREACMYGMAYDEPKDMSVMSQFDLVCDYSSLTKLSQTLVIVGQGIGAFFFTILSDRFGRKTILVSSNIGLLVSGLIIAYAPNFIVFATFKLIAGAFQQGCVSTFATLCLEMMTTKNRRVQAFWGGLVWGLSSMTLSLWAYLFRNHSWRTLQSFLCLGSLPFILQLWYGRESLRWLIANGKSKRVVEIIRYATKMNKTSFECTMKAYEDACNLWQRDEEGKLQVDQYEQGTATKKLTLLDLLRIKRLLLNAVIMWLAWFTTALSYFAIYMTSTTLAGNPYLNFFLTTVMEVPNNFALYYFLNRFGRKVTLVSVYVLVSVGLIGCGIFKTFEENTLNSVMAIIFSCIAMSGASASFTFVFFYTPEIFPTNMRNQAVGVSSLMGRVGGMIAPFTGILSEKAKWAPGVLIGCIASLVCLLSYFLPETRGRELPQTIQDVELWFSGSSYFTEVTDEEEEDDPHETDSLAK